MSHCTSCYCTICTGCEYNCGCNDRCRNCAMAREEHGDDGKCLFGASNYARIGSATEELREKIRSEMKARGEF